MFNQPDTNHEEIAKAGETFLLALNTKARCETLHVYDCEFQRSFSICHYVYRENAFMRPATGKGCSGIWHFNILRPLFKEI